MPSSDPFNAKEIMYLMQEMRRHSISWLRVDDLELRLDPQQRQSSNVTSPFVTPRQLRKVIAACDEITRQEYWKAFADTEFSSDLLIKMKEDE